MEQKELLAEFEKRVVGTPYCELNYYWQNSQLFTIGIGTAASAERWYLYIPSGETHHGDSLEEVLLQGERVYPLLREWLPLFHAR